MLTLVLRRVLLSLLTLALVAVTVFVATEILPGDVAAALLGRDATPAAVEELRQELDLDDPAPTRFLDWVSGIAQGDFGTSLTRDRPVSEMIGTRLRNTLLLAGTALLIGVPLALGLGIVAGLKRDRSPDLVISVGSLIAMSLPEFVVGTLLILAFAVHWTWFPAITTVPADAPVREMLSSLILPAVSLVIVMSAYMTRMVRTAVIDVMSSTYVTTATLRGIPRGRIVLRHALPNVLLPTINVVALTIGWLLGGVVIIESVFNYPGIGTLTVEAVQDRDLPLIQALALLGALTYVLVNTGADLLGVALNPRLRSQVKSS